MLTEERLKEIQADVDFIASFYADGKEAFGSRHQSNMFVRNCVDLLRDVQQMRSVITSLRDAPVLTGPNLGELYALVPGTEPYRSFGQLLATIESFIKCAANVPSQVIDYEHP